MSKPWLDDGDVILYHGDVCKVLHDLPAESVHCVVTSPPYW
jgi:DNA modification methylase